MSTSTARPASPALAASRAPLTVWLFFAASWLIGWWLVFDGLHQRLFGDFVRIGGQLGPWADLARAAGLDPLSFGWFFIVLGFWFIAASFGVYLRGRWGFRLGLLASAIGLLYLGPGTPVAVICLVSLLLRPTRTYLSAGA